MNAKPRIIVFSCHQTGLSVSCSVKCQSASQLVTQSVFLGMSVYLSACQHILPFLSLLIDFLVAWSMQELDIQSVNTWWCFPLILNPCFLHPCSTGNMPPLPWSECHLRWFLTTALCILYCEKKITKWNKCACIPRTWYCFSINEPGKDVGWSSALEQAWWPIFLFHNIGVQIIPYKLDEF